VVKNLLEEGPDLYHRIGDYAAIGNGETVALIAPDGSIDWLCLPKFDSPAIFCRLLDDDKGGYFALNPIEEHEVQRGYIPETNVFRSVFTTADGEAILTDAMTIELTEESQSPHPRAPEQQYDYAHRPSGHREIVRRLECRRGSMRFRLTLKPTFNFARSAANFESSNNGLIAWSENHFLVLSCDAPFQIDGNQATADFLISEGDSFQAVLYYAESLAEAKDSLASKDNEDSIQNTVQFWREWSKRCHYTGKYHDVVHRSALTLKLMHFSDSGALVAAPTTSLPEEIGGVRNWDYRYSWLRDSAMTLHALFSLGYTAEGDGFFHWMEETCSQHPYQIMYAIDGSSDIPENCLDHLSGYMNSKPVRVGNAAAEQRQLDIFGPVLDAAYLYANRGGKIDQKLWSVLAELINYVVQHWREPDRGIWEVRSGDRQFVYSKLMAWVALDRGLRLSKKFHLPADQQSWGKIEKEIRIEILTRGFNKKIQSFTQYYDTDKLDASLLMVPIVGFLPAMDPRVVSTVKAISENLTEHGLVYRYRDSDDGIEGDEGSFTICSFWLVENLALQGEIEKAEEMFNRLLKYFEPLNLIAEEIDPVKNLQLGNYPQGLSHVGLINAALSLKRRREKGPEEGPRTYAERIP